MARLLLLFLLQISVLRATSVDVPSLRQLVNEADIIAETRVTAVKSAWEGEKPNRKLVTWVTLKKLKALKGNPAASLELRHFGGQLDGAEMWIKEAPRFQVGDHDILFIRGNRQSFFPLVGLGYGRWCLRVQDGETRVFDSNGRPLTRTTLGLAPEKSSAQLGRNEVIRLIRSELKPKP